MCLQVLEAGFSYDPGSRRPLGDVQDSTLVRERTVGRRLPNHYRKVPVLYETAAGRAVQVPTLSTPPRLAPLAAPVAVTLMLQCLHLLRIESPMPPVPNL
ncbi:hypothetical protein EVAR_3451_1 [Eumeta japonica]|uniref:Uncharacterized protein n=1 Tax=Eumeta variegata TaxID=151549 RepID=A0A4C1SSC0_EUMVA|nr:hypothetical protein EVAR_3451_1 [Eumeta japonica]